MNRSSSNVLERGRIFPSTNPSRAVDGTDGAACVAVSAAVRHAFGPSVRVDPRTVGNWRNGRSGDNRRHRRTPRINGSTRWIAVKRVVGFPRDDGNRIWTSFAFEGLERLRLSTTVEGRKTRRGSGYRLSLLALRDLPSISAKVTGLGASKQVPKA
jgi:hypothetical protein